MKKKSFNPFKMWGSWIGAIVLPLIISPFMTQSIFQPCIWTFNCSAQLGIFNTGSLMSVMFYGIIVIGFLVGWGIHSLVRVLKK